MKLEQWSSTLEFTGLQVRGLAPQSESQDSCDLACLIGQLMNRIAHTTQDTTHALKIDNGVSAMASCSDMTSILSCYGKKFTYGMVLI
jgi:hypothetical protein